MKNNLNALADIAIKKCKELNPTITSDFIPDNISSTDIERLLWYILQNYPVIANDQALKSMVLENAQKKGSRNKKLNKFLHFYFSYVLADLSPGEPLSADAVTEESTELMLDYVLSKYKELWHDTTLLQGIALFTRTSPVNWWN